MKVNINNSAELKTELVRLSRLRKEQEIYLGDQYTFLRNKIQTPSRVIGAVASNIPGFGLVKDVFSFLGKANSETTASSPSNTKSDWFTKVAKLALPLVLNRTVLKNSGWLKKSLVLLASEGAMGQVSKDKVSSFVGKIANFVRPEKSKKKHKKVKPLEEEEDLPNFGIPPNSETY
ncbi:hypothetical protein [Sphingobacterium bovistauri]|uniref:Uncharacterized protein n=1 Tax=Sphingobacterium bovistauri TaxID=2781959 RepID=A0ABS7Z740_9SPHI|nr:hypothetical protein [Sphingobacterium bovistauri]MCA5006000.1 hypothetical protein [Sphingobacterium bovistauri]